MLVDARRDRITRRAHTLSGLLEEGYQVQAADMPGADDLMMRIYAAVAQKERELTSERTRAVLGGPDTASATLARREAAERAAH
ncbi:Resolvase, N terminal domain [Belnapia rosea]|uniref:Resolvase, N terminal domain n=1 Tax=Belnapia rosea TaxID=938405 RepID=A0A1G7DY91_9PROT|nr:Resolvase, N terminal domain [Belnapia rosea]